ncbi:MAG: hypothetical protein KDA62_01255, partial [Planctomycetales bacterium]|nr:hypothetical protein [Planctomycetales bacterium]
MMDFSLRPRLPKPSHTGIFVCFSASVTEISLDDETPRPVRYPTIGHNKSRGSKFPMQVTRIRHEAEWDSLESDWNCL